MLKLSQVTAAEWKDSIGIEAMRPLPQAGAEDRASLGPGKASLRTRDHSAVVYWDNGELFETVIPYLREGLRAGDKVVYVADDSSIDAVAGEGRVLFRWRF
jgi:hypothetical protein